MDEKKKKILGRFLKANNLEVKADFRNKTKVYTGLRTSPMTEQELWDSIEMTGFIDGYEGNPRRFSGHKGTTQALREKESDIEIFAGFMDIINKIPNLSQMIDKEVPEFRTLSRIPAYHKQYELGKTYFQGN